MTARPSDSAPRPNANSPAHRTAPRGLWVAVNGTAFVASFCVMVIELVAGRLIARHLGSSLYTWTSVIGVVLAGLATGNYLGGRLADRYPPRRLLAALFAGAAATAGSINVVDNLVADWPALWLLSWPGRVAMHVALVFFLPAAFLGMISPAVGKWALDQGRACGRTLGSVYAWGVIGSILGTFATGYYLIAAFGTTSILWTVAVVLALVGAWHGARAWWSSSAAATTVAVAALALLPSPPVRAAAQRWWLRPPPNSAALLDWESQYARIQVRTDESSPGMRVFVLDTLLHSQIDLDHPLTLHYEYERIYAALTRSFALGRPGVDNLTIGGGGYVYPRWMQAHWPASRTDVVEIDPAVTAAAVEAFGLPQDAPIGRFHEDGRVFVARRAAQRARGEDITQYDVIYLDVFSDCQVPVQLTTREFVSMAKSLLRPDGMYVMNLIDILDSGRMLGAMVATLRSVFPHVAVFVEWDDPASMRRRQSTFVLVGACEPVDSANVLTQADRDHPVHVLPSEELDAAVSQADGLVLTDDYAPVEEFVRPVMHESAHRKACQDWLARARAAFETGHLEDALRYCTRATEAMPSEPLAQVMRGVCLVEMQRPDEARAALLEALRANPDFAPAHVSLAQLLIQTGDEPAARVHLESAVKIAPQDVPARVLLGGVLLNAGEYEKALDECRAAATIAPDFYPAFICVGTALEQAGRVAEAVEVYLRAAEINPAGHEALARLAELSGQQP